MKKLEGIIPPLPTSFSKNEELFTDKISENIAALLQYKLSGILVLGSNGELVMLSELEKEKVYATAREAIPDGKTMLAGCGGQSTRETIHLCRLAAKHGADAALVLNPFYYRGLMTDDVLVRHYHKVADESPIPIVIYNMPVNTGLDMSAGALIRMAGHPNIIGLKDSGKDLDKMAMVVSSTSPEFSLVIGSANLLLPALKLGAKGGILAFANIKAKLCLELLEAFNEGDSARASAIQESIIPLNTFVTRQHGVPALKAALDSIGLYGGPPRRPLLPLNETSLSELERLLEPGRPD